MNGLSAHAGLFCEFGLTEVMIGRVHQGVNHVADAAMLGQDTPPAWILITEVRHVFVSFCTGLSARHTQTVEPKGVESIGHHIDDLEAADLLEQSNDGRPAEYTAHEIDLQLVAGDAEQRITVALVEAVARRIRDDDIDTYIDRHGLDGLAVALEYAHEYADGAVTHHIMAREQALSPLEAGVILDALRPIIED